MDYKFSEEDVKYVMKKKELSREDAETLLKKTAQALDFKGLPVPPVRELFEDVPDDELPSGKEFLG